MNLFVKIADYFHSFKRILVLTMVLVLLPIFCISFFYYQYQHAVETEKKFSELIYFSKKNQKHLLMKRACIKKHSSPCISIQPTLETFSPLAEEKHLLENIQRRDLSKQVSDQIENRLYYLMNTNRVYFSFTEERNSPLATEREIKLSHPLECSTKDISQLIRLLESPGSDSKNKPQIIIKKFSLERPASLSSPSNYLINFQLIQREFHEKNS